MRILVTGGAGYIGSHTTLELLEAAHDVVVVDNLANSSDESLRRVAELAGRDVPLHVVDILDRSGLDAVFATAFDGAGVEAVIHFAGLKAVGESVADPLRYYEVNVAGTLNLLRAMGDARTHRLVFSSSATVYGAPEVMPLVEGADLAPVNPYGRTKRYVESMLEDLAASDPRWNITNLRYFNPVGAHPSGRIGEDPHGIPGNLMPFVAQVAVGRRDRLTVHGDDYPTQDGTAVRDYIHVVDLARGHLAALERTDAGARAYNLGTGNGTSVLHVVAAYERAVGRPIPYVVGPRRTGDAAVSFCDPSRAADELGWRADHTVDAMCVDSWRWQSTNPNGYGGEPGDDGGEPAGLRAGRSAPG